MPHWKYIYDLLNELCVKVIISCNKAQAELFSKDVEKIIDEESFLDSGPMAGLMSAFNKYNDAAFLYVGGGFGG